MTYDEIMARLAAIRDEVNTEGADLEALEREAQQLGEQRDALAAQAMQRTDYFFMASVTPLNQVGTSVST